MKTVQCTFFLFLLSSALLFAQKPPSKFGEVSMKDLEMNSYPADTSAVAVVLVDYGESRLQYNQQKGFQLIFERLRRIKILKKEGFTYADYAIRTYRSNDNEEKVNGLKAVTYNLENGKIVESKLKSDGVFKEKVDKNNDLTKFTLPNVKEGSVIEYTYRVTSDFVFNFRGWEFQAFIPVVWSEYRAAFPEYFHYDKYTQGYIGFHANEHKTVPSSITFQHKERGDQGTQFSNSKLDFQEHRYRWVAKDVPAFKSEPYLTTPRDYISRINFELSHTAYPQQPIKKYMGTWDDINRFYQEHSEFGGEIKGNGFLKKTVEEVTAGITSPLDKIAAIHSYLKNTVEWNGISTDFTRSNLRKVLDDKKGNSAEINLLLASMLDKAGFAVNGVLTSTRDHGFIREHIAVSSQFNYVLCLVHYEDKNILIDATEPLLPVTTLPERCLNGRGFVIAKDKGTWININTTEKTKTLASFKLKLHPDGHLDGKAQMERSGYSALQHRRKYLNQGEETYVKEFKGTQEWDVIKSQFENLKDLGQSFKENYDIEMNSSTTVAGDIVYINPFFKMQKGSNPFKLEKREYPVDFGYPHDEVYMVQIEIPDGYVVDELPQSKVYMLPQATSRYMYNVNVNGNIINVTSSFQVNKSLFTQLEYNDLREFFNQIVAKQSEQIVLKKKM